MTGAEYMVVLQPARMHAQAGSFSPSCATPPFAARASFEGEAHN